MRTHSQIVHDAGVAKIREVLSARGLKVSDPTVRSWARRPADVGSIPSSYWNALADAKVSTLKELAAHAEAAARRDEEAA